MPKIKVRGQTVQTGECPQQTDTHAHTQTNRRTSTHTDTTKCIISPATRSIIKDEKLSRLKGENVTSARWHVPGRYATPYEMAGWNNNAMACDHCVHIAMRHVC